MTLTLQDIATGKARVQSPYLYMQAAGSTGLDGSSPGIHLRWDLLRSLGDTHLPKGNLAAPGGLFPASAGFSKPDDFVTVLRAPYDNTYPVILDFRSLSPAAVFESGTTRSWRFSVTVNNIPSGEAVNVLVRFMDVAGYDTVRASINPATATKDFVAAYEGGMEVEVEGNLCFAITWVMQQTVAITPGQLRTEVISVEENLNGASRFLSTRKTFVIEGELNASSPSRPIAEQVVQLDVNALLDREKIYSENIRYVRFDYADAFPVAIMLETYRHFIQAKVARNEWITLRDDFSLSIDNAVVFERLEDTPYPVDHQWPRYFGSNTTTGLFTANVANYSDKWNSGSEGNEGLRDLVLQYLDLSSDPENPSGSRVLHPKRLPGDPFLLDTEQDYIIEDHPVPVEVADSSEGEVIDEAATVIDSLSILKLISSDFHAARMFGLGHIDAGVTDNEIPYVYIALYETAAALEPGQAAAAAIHVSMTLPTRRLDYRLPVTTVLKELTYGLKSLRGSTRTITDPDGYIPNAAVRMINLHIESPNLGEPIPGFFEDTSEFSTDNVTLPICYGIKYKKDSDPDWGVPELSNDQEYQDASGVNETIPLTVETSDRPEVTESKLYVHAEEEEGVHQYAVYGVNWFSRVSALSNIQQTTETEFSLADIATLLPPSNFAVQLIQQEDPPVLTTDAEQAILQALISGNPGGDHTMIRVTFEWNHAHNIAHQWADKAQFFFRQNPLRIVRGEITSVTEFSNDVVEVHTAGFTIFSTTVTQTFNAKVLVGDELRFKGSIFATDKNQYVVEEVLQGATDEGSIFRLRKIVQGSAQDIDNDDEFIITDDLIIPAVGERFFVTENLGEAGNWTDGTPGTASPLTKQVDLITFTPEHLEQVAEFDGSITTLHTGGIFDTATITEFEDVEGFDDNGQEEQILLDHS